MQTSSLRSVAAAPLQMHGAVVDRPAFLIDLEQRLEGLTERCDRLFMSELARFSSGGRSESIRRYLFAGPSIGAPPIRLALFAGIHGDEPEGAAALVEFLELLDAAPSWAAGYHLYVYPLCNPTGLADGTRTNRRGLDLNRFFWTKSDQPEVVAIERELLANSFHGLISLHSDDTAEGLYAFSRGTVIAEALARPMLDAGAHFLPQCNRPVIDGFAARDGIIRSCYDGILSSPQHLQPTPFEIIFETPQRVAPLLQRLANLAALRELLRRYSGFLSLGDGI